MKIIAPTQTGALTHDGVTYPIVDGLADVPAAAAAVLIESHGFRAHGAPTEGEDIHDLEPRLTPKEATLAMIEKMARPELLSAIAASRITFVGGRNNQQLRAMLREHVEGGAALRQADAPKPAEPAPATEAPVTEPKPPESKAKPADAE